MVDFWRKGLIWKIDIIFYFSEMVDFWRKGHFEKLILYFTFWDGRFLEKRAYLKNWYYIILSILEKRAYLKIDIILYFRFLEKTL